LLSTPVMLMPLHIVFANLSAHSRTSHSPQPPRSRSRERPRGGSDQRGGDPPAAARRSASPPPKPREKKKSNWDAPPDASSANGWDALVGMGRGVAWR
jgi:hypothetical protein